MNPDHRPSRTSLSRRSFNGALGFGALSLCTGISRIAAAAGWEKMDEKDGIRVYRKDIAHSPLEAFRGTAIIDAPFEKVIWVLADNTRRKEWVDRLETSTILERKSTYDFVMYQHFSAPVVVSDRDFVFRAKARSRKDGTAILEVASVKHKKAPPTVGVRGNLTENVFAIRRVGNKTHLDVIIMTDPKGSIPNWVVNLVQKSWPMNTLEALRAHVKKPFVGSLAAPPLG